jgi:hypothetical protein
LDQVIKDIKEGLWWPIKEAVERRRDPDRVWPTGTPL